MTASPPKNARYGEPQDRPLLQDHPLALKVASGLWAISALLFLAVAVPSLKEWVQTVDDAVHSWVVSLEWAPAVFAAQVLDTMGTAWVVWPAMFAVAAWLAWGRRWAAVSFWLVSMFLSQLMIGPVKALYERPRPTMSLVETSGWSFPSGHSVVGAAVAIAAVIVLVPAGSKRRNLEMAAALFAVVMALSRVYLRAHWLSDVGAGAALGAAIAIGTAALVHRIDDRRRGRDHHAHLSEVHSTDT
jgi:membrane-associated phospholipid phosphatase